MTTLSIDNLVRQFDFLDFFDFSGVKLINLQLDELKSKELQLEIPTLKELQLEEIQLEVPITVQLEESNLEEHLCKSPSKVLFADEVAIKAAQEISPTKKWIKLIDFDTTINITDYNNRDDFIKVSNIELDVELSNSAKKKGLKKRESVIRFVPLIPNFADTEEWIYIFTINGRIVKVGGTRTGLKSRITSYLSGHQTVERGKTGGSSSTNAYIYNTFEFYLQLGYTIEMYALKLPKVEIKVHILGKEVMIKAQIFHAFETKYLENFRKEYGKYPPLSDNCDPSYK